MDWLVPSHEAKSIADDIGYPVLVRPSYVLGGRGMEIVYDESTLVLLHPPAPPRSHLPTPCLSTTSSMTRWRSTSTLSSTALIFTSAASWSTSRRQASTLATRHARLPPITLGAEVVDRIRCSTEAIARGVGVRGLINIQFAQAGDTLFVLEANPRASRTVPFVSKATATPLAKAAARIMLGATVQQLRDEGLLRATGDGTTEDSSAPIAVKEAVMPFNRFRTVDGISVDTILGPEMRSTGEVMGLDVAFGTAFAKSQVAGFGPLAYQGHGLHLGRQPRQTVRDLSGEAPCRSWF